SAAVFDVTDSELLDALERFHALLGDPKTKEVQWQKLFAECPYILSSSLPLRVDPRHIIPLATPGRMEPDFVIRDDPAVLGSPRGIIELKLHTAPVLTFPSADDVTLTRGAAKAVSQVYRYDHEFPWPDRVLVLGDDNQTHKFVIMGMSKMWADRIRENFVRGQLAGQLRGVRLFGYDQIFEAYRRSVPQKLILLVPRESHAGLIPLGCNPQGLEEYLHELTHRGPIPGRRNGVLQMAEETGLILVRLPAGKFLMGSAHGPDDERPVHEVPLDEFMMAAMNVTESHWTRFRSGGREGRLPTVDVSWEDAAAFCDWAGLSLPTEAQWEYACRAGTATNYWSGDAKEDLARVGWYYGNSGNRLHPVGEKSPNPFGLYDMHGNVWERCLDWFGSYETRPRSGDGARHLGSGSARVYRGGSFADGAPLARSAFRSNAPPGLRADDLGFRPARYHA
ncbi:MAG: formylglycine-generating enzyme family protein, partial [bacterium]|nr:formylglycine-generating enzyme family protein [bacterium]